MKREEKLARAHKEQLIAFIESLEGLSLEELEKIQSGMSTWLDENPNHENVIVCILEMDMLEQEINLRKEGTANIN